MLPLLFSDYRAKFTWLQELFGFDWLLDLLMDWWYWVLQVAVDVGTWLLSQAVQLMPSFDIATDGVASLNVNVDAILSMLAWIFPFDALLFCLSVIGLNYIAYFSAGPILRWVNIIR